LKKSEFYEAALLKMRAYMGHEEGQGACCLPLLQVIHILQEAAGSEGVN